MYEKLIEYFKELDLDDTNKLKINKYCKSIVTTLETGLESMEYYEKYSPVRFLVKIIFNIAKINLLLFIIGVQIDKLEYY